MRRTVLIFCLKIKSTPPQTDRWADLLEAKLRIWFNNECLGRGWGVKSCGQGLTSKYCICCSGREMAKWKTQASTATFTCSFGYFVHCRYLVECHHKGSYTLHLIKHETKKTDGQRYIEFKYPFFVFFLPFVRDSNCCDGKSFYSGWM